MKTARNLCQLRHLTHLIGPPVMRGIFPCRISVSMSCPCPRQPLGDGRSRSLQSDPKGIILPVTPSLNGRVPGHRASRPQKCSRIPDGPGRKRKLQFSTEDEPASKSARLNFSSVPPAPLPVAGDENCLSCYIVCCAIKLKQPHKKSCFSLPITTHTRCADSSRPPVSEISHHHMKPLALYAEKWKALPNASRWVMSIIEKGYTLQFARRPLRFNSVVMSTV